MKTTEGFREALQACDRPIWFGVAKLKLGLTPDDFAALATARWMGDLDVEKDDEMLTHSPCHHVWTEYNC
jgi:ribulose-bisphosphate carboxylase large chain